MLLCDKNEEVGLMYLHNCTIALRLGKADMKDKLPYSRHVFYVTTAQAEKHQQAMLTMDVYETSATPLAILYTVF